jgi:hypothetical protein
MCVLLIFILSLICCLFPIVSSSIWIFTMPSTTYYARFEQNVLGFQCTIDAKTILWRTTSFLPIFRLRRNRERLQDRATGTERTNRRHIGILRNSKAFCCKDFREIVHWQLDSLMYWRSRRCRGKSSHEFADIDVFLAYYVDFWGRHCWESAAREREESYDKLQEMALEKKIEAAESVDVGGKH